MKYIQLILKMKKISKNSKKYLKMKKIKKISNHLSRIYILLKQQEINLKGIEYDAKIAGYILNPTDNK